MLAGGELVIDHAALSLADTLNDDLLGRLRRDAPELARIDRHFDLAAELGALGDLLRLLKRELNGGVFDLLLRHHIAQNVHIDLFLFLVHLHDHVVRRIGIVLAEGSQHSLVDLVVHILAGNAFLPFDILDGTEKFCVHAVSSVKCPRAALRWRSFSFRSGGRPP